ncbi:DUF418 domain-containing protein [Sphingomicrobium flavum]|uniref:DUF418 domain-containing protein n=1 Tax=Sphingomicrobium flavum TaxID=1229164 RepID=UPI0021AD7FB9|nr:DUF418 domain-containing protein [Sphingomicrobium flavum]
MTDRNIGPVGSQGRIETIDVLRGFAILGIIFFNMPYISNDAMVVFGDIRAIGWTSADQWTYRIGHVYGADTMRGMLQILLGAGLMLFARKAMGDDAPAIYGDIWIRRNLWLAMFGLINVYLLFWVGDILFSYALAAILLFPFRKLSARFLLGLGIAYLFYKMVNAGLDYRQAVADYKAPAQAGMPAFPDQHSLPFGQMRAQGFFGGLEASANGWRQAIWASGQMMSWVIEGAFTMMIGMALFKWGLVQGEASKRFYLMAMIILYAFGLSVRWVLVDQEMNVGSAPIFLETFKAPARLAMTLGHIALLVWILKGRGAAMLAWLKAPGRMAFSVYLSESFICSHILFAPYGFDLWAKFGWFEGMLASLAIIAFQVAFAHLWLRHFRFGPLEWAWRSLTYWRRQPIRNADQPQHYGP